ncbi:MAG: Ig-like domain-containing protein [Fibrobacterota bacterium]|nr:Ig-like domain-containing protein [Chitinispirillaceae bacterium]
MTCTYKYLWLIGIVVTLGLFCTIRDDNGNPVKTDVVTTTPNDTIPVVVTPALFASADSVYVRIRDTLSIHVTAIKDSSLRDSITPLSYAKIKATVSKGRLISDSVIVDRNGRGIFRFTDTVAGRVEMTLRCNGALQTLRFDVSNAPDQIQKLIEIHPEKSVMLADGRDSSTISVSVINSSHNPIANECVQFISTAGVIIGNSDKCGNGQSITNSAGVATARLISSNINDTAFVTVYLVSDRTLSDEAEIAFKGLSIKTTSNKSNLTIGDTAVVTATVLNASGVPVSKAPIFFSLKNTPSNLQILSMDSTTNYEGVAIARVRAATNGSDIVNAISSGATSTLQLNVSTLSLKLDINKTVLQTMENDSSRIIATFSNASGAGLQGRTVKITKSYKTELGNDTTQVVSGTTDAGGKAIFIIPSIPYEGSMKIEAIGYDNVEGYASTDTLLQFITTRIMTIRAPEFVAADGSSKGQVTVSIKNRSGNPIINDVVLFSASAGIITAQGKTDADGKAVAWITSDRRNMIATVTARLQSDTKKSQTIDVVFSGVEIMASAQPPSISSNGRDTAVIAAILTDAAKNPIAGERINFAKQKDATSIVMLDSITNNRGEARCKIVGTGTGTDTIKVSAAGATTPVALHYSSNLLTIAPLAGQSMIANGRDSTIFEVTYLLGDKVTPIPNASVEVNFTVGLTADTLFAKVLTTDGSGKARFTIRNPSFAVPATVSGLARSSLEVTSCVIDIYFKASRVYQIKLSGTSEVINVNGDKSKIFAVAYDSLGNRVKDARIAFNLLAGPSGGEYLDPPYAITGDDGVASTNFVSGRTPSAFRQVWISAGDFASVKSDTLKFTIAGPPKYITIRTNLLEGKNPKDGTFILPCAAIVTDVNGNPVADGTEVSFSLQVSGYVASHETTRWEDNGTATTGTSCDSYRDTLYYILPFEDFNDNLKLDPGEDRNGDGMLNRGEDLNGDGIYDRGPAFEDINKNGVRDFNWSTMSVERLYLCGTTRLFGDLNFNGHRDPVEPLSNVIYLSAYYRLLADSAFYYYPTIRTAADSSDFAILWALDSAYMAGSGYIPQKGSYDADNDWNGISDPNTAVSIIKTVQTSGGKALNEVLYGQTDASRIEIMIWAESQGVRTLTPEKLILPIVKSD